MSNVIDQKVVEMRFDNKQFESATKETIGTLSKLKDSLKMTESVKGLEGLDKAASNIKLDGIAAGVEALQKRFSTFGIIGMQVIQNITNSLYNTLAKGINFVTGAIVNGGIKRAMNIENAHFQLQALLKDEEKVQAVMADANAAVTDTAYGYDEAAKAASQFAASGLQAGEQMQRALKGITGVAAMTNASFEDISRIFTTVAGNGRLMGDQLLQLSGRGLNAASTIAEFVNQVNEGSMETTDSVKATITELTDGLKVAEGDIRAFVSEGKISFELFAEAMGASFGDSAKRANETFTGAISNLKAAFGRIGAGFISPLIAQNSELILLFNALKGQVNNVKKALVFDESVGNVNALSKSVTDTLLNIAKAAKDFINNVNLTKPLQTFYYWVEIVKNVAKGVVSAIKPIASAFAEVFFTLKMDDLVNFSKKLMDLTKEFKLSDESAKNLRDAAKGVFDVIRLLGDGFINLLKSLTPIGTPIKELATTILSFAGDIGRALSSFVEFARSSSIVSKASELLRNGITKASAVLTNFISSVRSSEFIHKVLEGIAAAFNKLTDALGKVKDKLGSFTSIFTPFISVLKTAGSFAIKILEKLGSAFKNLITGLGKALGAGDFDAFMSLINTGLMTGIGTGIVKFIEKLTNVVKSAGGIFANVNATLRTLKNTLLEYQSQLKANVLKTIAVSVAILAGSLWVLASIDSNKLYDGLKAVTVLIADLMASMAAFQKISSKFKGSTAKMNTSLIVISAAVLILASALKKVADVDPDRLFDSMTAITVLFAEMTGISILLSKFGGKVKTGAVSIIAFAVAINILTSAVRKLGELNVDVLRNGLISVGVLLAELAAFLIAAHFGGFKVSQAVGILVLSAALLMLQKSVEFFGSMDLESLKQGLISVGVILAELAGFNFASGKAKHVISSAASVLIIAEALKRLEGPLMAFGGMRVEEIAKGLLAMAGSLGSIALAMNYMPKNSLSISIGLIAVAQALKMISDVFTTIKSLSMGEIGKGLLVIAASMTIFAIALNAMKGTLGASAAVFVAAAALNMLVPVIKNLGQLSLGEIIKGLLAIGGAFAVIGAAGALLGPLVPSILALSGAIALLGVGCLAAGVGILALSAGLAGMGASSVVAANSLVQVIKTLTIGFLTTIVEAASELGLAVKTLVTVAAQAIIECTPLLVEAAVVIIRELLTALNNNIGFIASSIIQIATKIIDAVSANLPEFIKSVMNLLHRIIDEVISELNGMDFANLVNGFIVVGLVTGLIAAIAAVAPLIPAAMSGIIGVAGVIAELTAVLAVIGGIAQIPGLSWFISEGGDFLEIIGTALGQFIGGLVGGVVSGFTSSLPGIGRDLSAFMVNLTPFIVGASKINVDALQGVKNLVEMVLLITAANLAEGVTRFLTGGNTLTEFGMELVRFGPLIALFAATIKNVDASAVQGAALATAIMSKLANGLPNTGGLSAVIFGDNTISQFGEELVRFGPLIAAFADTVKNIDPNAVKGAASIGSMMVELANSLPKTGGLIQFFTGGNDLSSFGKGLVSFGESMKAYSDSVSGVDANHLSAVVGELKKLIDVSAMIEKLDTSSMSKFAKGLRDLSNNAINDFILAFQNGSERVSTEIGKGIDDWIQTIKSKEDKFKSEGKDVINAFINAASATGKSGMQKLSKEMYENAKNVIKGFVQGIEKNQKEVTNIMTKLGNSANAAFQKPLDIHSPSGKMFENAKNTVSGYVNGVTANTPRLEQSMAGLADAANTAFSTELDLNAVYDAVGGLPAQINKVADEVESADQRLLENSQKQTAAKEKSTVQKKAANNKAVKVEEDYWTQLLAVKKAGADAEKYQDMKIEDFRKEVLEETKKVLEEYTSQLESTRDSIMSQMDLFAEVEEQEAKSKYELISNLKDQINAYEDYVQVLGTLNTRLEGTELGEYIKTMGVDSLAQLEEINSMTDTELNRYAMLYDEKLALAGEAAQIQLSNLKTESEAKLAELFGGMASSVELFDFASIFDGSIESITKYVQDVMLPLDQATRDAAEASKAIGMAIDKGLVDGLTLDETSEVADQLTKVIDHIKEVNEEPATDAGKEVGENITEGVGEGLTEDTATVAEKTKELMDLIEKYMKEEGEIHSPSARSNREIGQPITQGVAEGMVETVKECTDSASNIMLAIVEAFKAKMPEVTDSIAEMMEIVKSGIQNEDVNLTDLGNKSILSFVTGIRNTFPDVRDSVNEMLDEIKAIFEKRQNEFDIAAVTDITLYLTAVRNKYEEARTVAHTFVNEILNSIKSHDSEFETAGAHAGQGFINGIKSKLREAAIAGAELARAAKNAVESELDINSPSKVMEKDGDFTTIGFVNGIYKNIRLAAKAGKALGTEVADAASDTMDDLMAVYDDFDLTGDPVIKPLVDMDNIYDARRQIEKLFNEAIDVASLSALSANTSFERGRQIKVEADQNQTGTTEKEAASFNFVQNNYSPKALSRTEIYRQTKNQFTTLKGLVDKA